MKIKIKKENWPLIIAFAAPILMILLVAVVIYLPNMFHKPKYDFIYSQGSYYRNYKVDSNGHVAQIPPDPSVPIPPPMANAGYPQLYYYNTQSGQSTPISLEQAQSYTLNPSPTSPDGYIIGYGNHSDGIFPLFISSSPDYNSRYIQGHGTNRKIDLPQTTDYYYNNFQFIGWVTTTPLPLNK